MVINHLGISRKNSFHDASNIGDRQVAVLLSGIGVDDCDVLVVLGNVSKVVCLSIGVQRIMYLGGIVNCVMVVILVLFFIILVLLVFILFLFFILLQLPFGNFSRRLIFPDII